MSYAGQDAIDSYTVDDEPADTPCACCSVLVPAKVAAAIKALSGPFPRPVWPGGPTINFTGLAVKLGMALSIAAHEQDRLTDAQLFAIACQTWAGAEPVACPAAMRHMIRAAGLEPQDLTTRTDPPAA